MITWQPAQKPTRLPALLSPDGRPCLAVSFCWSALGPSSAHQQTSLLLKNDTCNPEADSDAMPVLQKLTDCSECLLEPPAPQGSLQPDRKFAPSRLESLEAEVKYSESRITVRLSSTYYLK